MTGASKTRTQRRMEKRQAVILLVLLLVVSLASFTLGVIVGRRGAERDLAQKIQQTERVLVAQAPAAAALNLTTADTPADTTKGVVEPKGETVSEETKLSFYDDLAKEAAPLGSGINLLPAVNKTVAPDVQPPIDLPEKPIVKKKSAAVAMTNEVQNGSVTIVSDKAKSGLPGVVAGGSHAVQVGSFGVAGDAIALKKKMLNMDYPAFVVEADLGEKGLWYRVRIGPYQDSVTAKKAQQILEEKEKMKGFITHQ